MNATDPADINRYYEGVVDGIRMCIELIEQLDPYTLKQLYPHLLNMIEEVISDGQED